MIGEVPVGLDQTGVFLFLVFILAVGFIAFDELFKE